MGTKLECKVDVAAAVDMMGHGEEWDDLVVSGIYEGLGLLNCK